MLIEIKVALNFLLSFLYDKLPRRRVNLFGEELEKCLKHKLTLSPNKNNLCLSLTVNKLLKHVDPCMLQAAKDSAMDIEEIVEQLPIYLKIYILPGKVACAQCTGSCTSVNGAKCKYCCAQGDFVDERTSDDDDETEEYILNNDRIKLIYNTKFVKLS